MHDDLRREQSGALTFQREAKSLTLRFANDGFLYLPVAVAHSGIGWCYSKGRTWCVLDDAVFETIGDLTNQLRRIFLRANLGYSLLQLPRRSGRFRDGGRGEQRIVDYFVRALLS